MENWVNENDIWLEDQEYPSSPQNNHTAMYDADGELIFELPFGTTYEQAKLAVSVANYAYREGLRIGDERKSRQIREAIGIFMP